jgi:hypothetical protein
MIRSVWIVCLVSFAIISLACGSGKDDAGPRPVGGEDATKRTGGDPDTPADKWEGVDTAYIIGGLQVTLRNPMIAKVPLFVGPDPVGESTDAFFVVNVELRSADPGKRFNYETWAKGKPTLKDDLGNRYSQITQWKSSGVHPLGRVETGTVYSDKNLTDILVFERPVPAATRLELELPATQFGEGRAYRFRMKLIYDKK